MELYKQISDAPKRMLPLLDKLKKYDNLKLKVGQKVQFDIPLL